MILQCSVSQLQPHTPLHDPVPQCFTSQRFLSRGGNLCLCVLRSASFASRVPLPHKLKNSSRGVAINKSDFLNWNRTLTEGKLFECLMCRLWEQEIHKDNLKHEPDTIADVESPTSIVDTDWIDELIEETCHSAEPLEYCDPLCTNMEREEFNQERCPIKIIVSIHSAPSLTNTYCK